MKTHSVRYQFLVCDSRQNNLPLPIRTHTTDRVHSGDSSIWEAAITAGDDSPHGTIANSAHRSTDPARLQSAMERFQAALSRTKFRRNELVMLSHDVISTYRSNREGLESGSLVEALHEFYNRSNKILEEVETLKSPDQVDQEATLIIDLQLATIDLMTLAPARSNRETMLKLSLWRQETFPHDTSQRDVSLIDRLVLSAIDDLTSAEPK